MRYPKIPVWKNAPFLRLLVPVIIGILLQWYLQFDLPQILVAAVCFFIAYKAFAFLPSFFHFKIGFLQGLPLNLFLIVLGAFLTYQKDLRHNQNWFGNVYHDSDHIIATINEPLLEKNKSYKADAIVENVLHNNSVANTSGKIIIYFEKDSANAIPLKYGDKILINKKLLEIKNSGNPGAFDYKQYSAFHQVFHNIFLKKNDWVLLDEKNINLFNQFLFTARQNVLNILQKNMQGHDDQAFHRRSPADRLYTGS